MRRAQPETATEPVNILLVDDELNNLKALDAVLAAEDRRLMWAQSGDDALRWLLKERFAVVLLDVHMPGMDGFETADLIRQHVRSESTPIIFLTAANKEASHVSRGYELGAVDYIFKPLDVSILRSKVAVFVDLFRKTEQVRRQAHLLTEARSFLQNVLESTTDYAIIAQDLTGTVMGWYEGARLLYGYASEEMVSKQRIETLFPGDEATLSRLGETFAAALERGRAEGEFTQVRKDGGTFTASVGVNVWRDAGDEVIGYVLVAKDVTEQRLQEERTRLLIQEQAARAEAESANRRFALLAQASVELARLLEDPSALQIVASLITADLAEVCMVDLMREDGEVERVATAQRKGAGSHRSAQLPAAGTAVPAFARITESQKPLLVGEISSEVKQDLGLDGRRKRSSASLNFTSAMLLPLCGQKGLIGVMWLLTAREPGYNQADLDLAEDLAGRVSLALENARLYREAQQAVSIREDFLSIASHELKTPVTSLRGQAQLMLRRLKAGRELDQAHLDRAFQVIDEQTAKLSRLMSQLLDVSRLQAGKLVLECSHTDVTTLVSGVVTRARLLPRGHTIEMRSPSEPVMAEVDALRLEQVVTNLLDNAVKFSPEGSRIEVEVAEPEDKTLRISVRDWGPGISPEQRPRIFDRFHQGTTKPYGSGMGLGLHISRQIVELHGGQIVAEFPADGGSRFTVSLPCDAAAV